MKLEDMCLTLEQARELKELGIDYWMSIPNLPDVNKK